MHVFASPFAFRFHFRHRLAFDWCKFQVPTQPHNQKCSDVFKVHMSRAMIGRIGEFCVGWVMCLCALLGSGVEFCGCAAVNIYDGPSQFPATLQEPLRRR
jgi:hypothetical protein